MTIAPLRRGIAALALGFTAVALLAFRPSAAPQEPPAAPDRPLPERVAALEQLAIEQGGHRGDRVDQPPKPMRRAASGVPIST